MINGILAVLAGLATTIVLSYGMDAILRATGTMPKDLPKTGRQGLIMGILAYRTVFNIAGCFVAAIIATSHPMAFALGLGAFGTLAALGGAMAKSALGPAYYNWSLVVTALPAAWVGGLLATM